MNGEPLPDRARLPRAHGRARSLRLRVGDEVGRRSRADDVRRLRRVLGAGAAGRRRARSRRSRASTCPKPLARDRTRERSRSRVSRGRSTAASKPSKCASTKDRGSRAELADELSIDTWRQWKYEWDATAGNHKHRSTCDGQDRRGATGRTRRTDSRTARPGGTPSSCASAELARRTPRIHRRNVINASVQRARYRCRAASCARTHPVTAAACGGDDDDSVRAAPSDTPTTESTTR